MLTQKCILVRTGKKVSYPTPAIIELIEANSIGPIKLFTNELRAGEILFIEFFFNRPQKIFKIDSSINQIFGNESLDGIIEIICPQYRKKIYIENYIKDIYKDLSINELIVHKNDFADFENEIIKYFLLKDYPKIDQKKIRSICFKTIKNSKMAEKLSNILKQKSFNYYGSPNAHLILDFESLSVQIKYDK